MSSIRDVAELAEVSTATVSHVINSTRYVSPELTERVRAVMLQLNYQPDAVARSLRRRETLTLGLLIPSVEIPFFASVAYGIERVASTQGYSIILCNSDWQQATERLHLRDLLARRVDGLICISAGIGAADVEPLIESGTPIVMFEEPLPDIELDVVGIDNRQGAFDATNHLLEQGHKRIGVVTGRPVYAISEDRLAGHQQALGAAGLLSDPALICEGDYLPAAGKEAVAHFLALAELPTAILAFNDLMAMGVLQALAENRLSTPKDVAVVGFDDIPLSQYTSPALSTVRQPLKEMCRVAIEILLQRIRGEGPEETVHIKLAPELVVRRSTLSGPVAIINSPAEGMIYARSDLH